MYQILKNITFLILNLHRIIDVRLSFVFRRKKRCMNYVYNFEENLFRQGSLIWMRIWRVGKEIRSQQIIKL